MRTTRIKNKFLKKNNFKSILNIDFRYNLIKRCRIMLCVVYKTQATEDG